MNRRMKGWWTVAFGAAVAVGPAALEYLGEIDWTTLGISPGAGGAIGSIIVVLRAMTNTPVGKKM